jgi:hypothetical protein
MNVLLDHLAATIVGTTVLLVLAGIMALGQSDAVDQTQKETHRERARVLATVLENDLRNAGAGVPPSQAPLLVASSDSVSFRAKDGFGDMPLRTITYRRVPDGTVRVGGTDVPMAAVERVVDGAVLQRYSGLSEFAFELRDDAGAATTDLSAGRSVHVRFAVGPPPQGSGDVDTRARYRRATRMPNLTP